LGNAVNKEEFKKAVSAKLKKIPLEDRREWDETNLLGWWSKAKADDSRLNCGSSGASDWELVEMCTRDLIGKDALS
jgi:hypothetical protein